MLLERQLLFTEKTSLSEYLRGNALNIEIHRLYDMYLANNEYIKPEITEIQTFNEIYYQCTYISNLKPVKPNVAYDYLPRVNAWLNNIVMESGSTDYAAFVSSVVAGVLSVISRKSNAVDRFIKCLMYKLSNNKYMKEVYDRITDFKKLYGTVDIDLRPNPEKVENLSNKALEWKYVTNGFSRSKIEELILRYKSDKDKLALICLLGTMAASFKGTRSILTFLSTTSKNILQKQERLLEEGIIPNQVLGEVGRNGAFLVERLVRDPRQDAELAVTKEKLAETERNLAKAWEQSEEYKSVAKQLKEQLGSTTITLDAIANSILRLPTIDLQYKAFETINALLVGTVWQTKAQEVLKKILEKREQKQPFNYYESGAVHEDHSRHLQICTKGSEDTTKLLTEL